MNEGIRLVNSVGRIEGLSADLGVVKRLELISTEDRKTA
jgi:hypothetical protein